jgi:hypothetical protein
MDLCPFGYKQQRRAKLEQWHSNPGSVSLNFVALLEIADWGLSDKKIFSLPQFDLGIVEHRHKSAKCGQNHISDLWKFGAKHEHLFNNLAKASNLWPLQF